MVAGIPVLLRDDVEQTSVVAQRSLETANAWAGAEADAPDGELFLDTLGASEAEKAQAADLARGGGFVDPVVSVLVAATSGLAYRGMIGALEHYPIPEMRLAPGGGAALLDVGCGWGRWSIAAARTGYRVVGVDPSLGAVAAARRVAHALGADARFVCGDARYLPFAADGFDAVFSYSVLQHFAKPEARRAIAEAARVLTPSGRALVQMPNAFGIRGAWHLLRRGFSPGSGFDVRYWTIPELERAFGESFREIGTSIHGFFGLGLERSDREALPPATRALIDVSERLRALGARLPPLKYLADSVYVSARK